MCFAAFSKINKLKVSFAGTQALVRPGSPHSSLSAEERIQQQPPICLAKALVDSPLNAYDKEALRFKVKCDFQNFISNCIFHILAAENQLHKSIWSNKKLISKIYFVLVLFLLQKGDIIEVISMNASGIWRGRCHGRLGHFKFINVEVMPDQRCRNNINSTNRGVSDGPVSVEDLLIRIGLKEYTTVFVLNG